MKRIKYKVKIPAIILSIIVVLCGCNLFVTDKDKFYIDETIDDCISEIDIEKAGKDIVIPNTVGDTTVRKIDFADPYYSKIDSLDVSKVKELESFRLNLFDDKNKSKLKELDFSKNKKLELDTSNNPNLESIKIADTNIKKLDVSHNPKLKYILIDEGIEVVGPTNAYIEYNKRTE